MALALSGCAGQPPDVPKTVTVTVTQTVTTAPENAAGPGTGLPDADVDPVPSTPSPTDGPVLDQGVAGRTLALADFFKPEDNWQESRYEVASKSDVQGIATNINSCDPDNGRSLALRLANNFSELTFKVGQGNGSDSTDQTLDVQILGNNKQIDIRRVPFNQTQPFTVKVPGVNALEIRFYLDDQIPNCGGSVQAVLSDAVLKN